MNEDNVRISNLEIRFDYLYDLIQNFNNRIETIKQCLLDLADSLDRIEEQLKKINQEV
jgi:uncharacterized coiled-coil protein SlyX